MKRSAGSFEKKIMIAAIAAAAGFVLMIGGVVTSLKNNVRVVTLEDLSEPKPLVEVKPYDAGKIADAENKTSAKKDNDENKEKIAKRTSAVDKSNAVATENETDKQDSLKQSETTTEAQSKTETSYIPDVPVKPETFANPAVFVHNDISDIQPIDTSPGTISAQEVSAASDTPSVSQLSKAPGISSTLQNNTTPQASAAPETTSELETPSAPSAPSGHYETVVISPERTVYNVEEFEEPVMENFSVFYDFDGNVLKMIPADKDSVSINPDGSVSSDPVGEYALYVIQNHLGKGNWFIEKHQTGTIHHDAMEGISDEEFKAYKNSLKSRKGLVYKKRTIPAVTEEVWVEDK